MTDKSSDTNVVDRPKPKEEPSDKKAHPWRVCPIGQHYVKTHQLTVPPSKKHPDGMIVTRHGHCAHNPVRRKDLLSYDEIKEVEATHFASVKNLPNSCKNIPHGNDFDHTIAGWVQYWNEVFKPKEPLEPNLVKALLWSESTFDKNIIMPTPHNKNGMARGLLQITDSTRKILSDHKGELRNHYIELSEADMIDPSANVCAAVRWLFRKKVHPIQILWDASWTAIRDLKQLMQNIDYIVRQHGSRRWLSLKVYWGSILMANQKQKELWVLLQATIMNFWEKRNYEMFQI